MFDPQSLEVGSRHDLRVGRSPDAPEAADFAGEERTFGWVHSYETGSTVDGPGVRITVFMSGCLLRCLYCHNPDTWNMTNGFPITLSKATEELARYRHGLRIMAGGFTLSGGEPLMQDRFAVKLLTAAKKMGIHTALDTTGYLGSRLSDAELGAIDLVLLDIKACDPAAHRRLTGMENGPVFDFAQRLASRHRPIWVRFVLVPGLTDDPANIGPIAAFAAGLGVVERVDVLPFHQMGRFKWKELGIEYKLDHVEPPTKEAVHHACMQFRAAGLKAY